MFSRGLTVKIKQRNVFVAEEVIFFFFFSFVVCFILCGYRSKYWYVCTLMEVIQWRGEL